MSCPEFQLLLCCARSRVVGEPIKNLVSRRIDWNLVLQLGAQHSVRPLLFEALKSVCWDDLPHPVKQALRQSYRANAQKNLRFTGELVQLVNVFKEEGIPLVVFKGPILAEAIYGNLALREFSDLDILVQEADVPRAEDILINRGYQPDFPDGQYRSAFLSYQGQYAFRNPGTGVSVDLHWQLSPRRSAFPLQSSEIWCRLEEAKIAGRRVPTLAPDDLALFLAAHGTKEGWSSLLWVSDFAKFLSKYQDLDWIEIYDRARRTHCTRALLLAVNLACRLLEAPAPAILVEPALKSRAVRVLTEKAQARMLSPVQESETRKLCQSLNTQDRLRDRLPHIVALLTTRTVGDYRELPLPKWLWPVYYFTRPLRLTMKAASLITGKQTSNLS